MRLVLFDFQERAVERVVRLLKAARQIEAAGVPQTVVLSAPTGAGKTVIATAAIEAFLIGDGEQPPDPAATFLWVTDQPELNRQTARKMLEASSGLRASDLVDVGPDFDQEKLAPGRVHFINTQKLRTGGQLAKRVDRRPFSFWDTVRATIEDPATNLYVVVDEAHRGAGPSEDDDVLPIMQRFLLGAELEDGRVPPAPVVLGISATPERFEALLKGGARGNQPVLVDPGSVRDSGLIKDRLHIVIPPDAAKTDELALLRSATEEWVRSWEAWRDYHAAHGGERVEPILMVQVADASRDTHLSATDVAAAIETIRAAAGELVDDERAFTHALDSRQDEAVGATTLRYVAPADVDGDPHVRVVFFKTSLNQGWDCPRAEVMMSFRTHRDATLIAQLVGRMVRTPLARRIAERDELNSVELFLPNFDEQTVERVREHLEGVVPSQTESDTAPPVTLVRAPRSARLFAALERLPTYTVPRVRRTKQTRRAMALAGLLDQHELTTSCTDETEARLVQVLLDAHARRADDGAFRDAIAEGAVIPVLVKAYDPYGGELGEDDERREVAASAERADRLFQYAGRVLGAGLHKPYLRRRFAGDGRQVVTQAKLEAAVLASDADLVAALERTARRTVDELLDRHGVAIEALDAAARADFERFLGDAEQPAESRLVLPESIELQRSRRRVPARHVYVEAGSDRAPIALRGWETDALRAAAAEPGFVGWLRNVDRRPHSLAVPYQMAGETRPLYPDLLVLRRAGGRLVVDLLDPHNWQLEDAVPKAKGLAAYAERHGHRFGRIESIVKLGRQLKRIDLKDSARRQEVFEVSGNDALRKLYR